MSTHAVRYEFYHEIIDNVGLMRGARRKENIKCNFVQFVFLSIIKSLRFEKHNCFVCRCRCRWCTMEYAFSQLRKAMNNKVKSKWEMILIDFLFPNTRIHILLVEITAVENYSPTIDKCTNFPTGGVVEIWHCKWEIFKSKMNQL